MKAENDPQQRLSILTFVYLEEESEILFPGFKLSEFDRLFESIQKQSGILYVSKDLAKYVCAGKVEESVNSSDNEETKFKYIDRSTGFSSE